MIQIGYKLLSIDRSERKDKLKECINLFNKNLIKFNNEGFKNLNKDNILYKCLFRGVFFPFYLGSYQLIIKISDNRYNVFNTKTKAPYLIHFEIIDIHE